MKMQEITVLKLESRTLLVLRKDAFVFRSDRPALWLQRICIWVLRKLKCFDHTAVTTYERHIIDGDTFMQRAMDQWEILYELLNRKPSRLLIGSEDYTALMHETESVESFSFQTRYCKDGPEFIGLKVEVIPWMRGMLVMP